MFLDRDLDPFLNANFSEKGIMNCLLGGVGKAFHKLLSNVLATSRISSNVFRFEQLFAF